MSTKYGTYVLCDPLPRRSGEKLLRWAVMTLDGATGLGDIKWFGRWRCYAFFPISGRVFEQKCLREIANWCEELTKEVRAGWKRETLQRKKRAAPENPVGVSILGGDPSL